MAPIVIAICVLAFVFWFLGRTSKSEELEEIGVAIIAGTMMALDIMIILASFDVQPGFNKSFLIGWFVLIFFIIGLYQSGGGYQSIYAISILCLIFGYLFTGPYSGYIKYYLEQVKAPFRIVFRLLSISFHDVMLMLTNPQQYIYEQQMKAVKTEAQQTQPKGVELSGIVFSPMEVPTYQKFYVQIRAENLGTMKADNVTINISCEKKKCEESYSYGPVALEPFGTILQQLGPFVAKEEKIGAEVTLKITLRSVYSAKSSLLVEVMNEEEIKRIMTDPIKRYELFKNVVATGVPSPAMLALSVGEQPLLNDSTQVLTIVIINKRIGDEEFIILPPGTKINITLPNTIGHNLNCSAVGMNCGIAEKRENKEFVSCEVERELKIPPMEFNKQPIVCSFISASITSEQIKRSDVITAELSGYIFEINVKKGPKVMLTSLCAKEGEKCEKLKCCGVLKCCEDKVCRMECKEESTKKEEKTPEEEKEETEKPALSLGDENYCEWKKAQNPNEPDKWCQEAEGNCKQDECSTTIKSDGGAALECRSGIAGKVKIGEEEKDVSLSISLCCFKYQDAQSCLEDYIRRGGRI